jgi:enterochelin esterase-like enzyme
MKIIKFSLLILCLNWEFAMAKVVNFIINVPYSTPEHSRIYLSGNLPEMCNWRPDCLKMQYTNNGSYTLALTVPDNTKNLSYKITRGNWETEAADSYSVPYNDIVIDLVKSNFSIIQNVIHWKDLAPLKKCPNVQSSILFSKELGTNKEMSIYIPPSYNSSTKSYPVIYMHDGQNVFDPHTSSFGIEWSIDETMNSLISLKKIKEAIIVAIHTNNTDRWNEYDYNLKGKKYSDFIVDSVIPFIEKNFRTIKNKDSRYLMGSSMGALISLMMLIDRPDVFSKAAGLSFPANIHERAIFRFIEKYKTLPQFDFYMDHGDQGPDAHYSAGAEELYSTLLKNGLRPDKLKYLVFPGANHTEADWARRAYLPLQYLLN